MSQQDPGAEQWHLDRRVPIALVAAILLQTLMIGVWVGSIDNRVATLEARQEVAEDVRERVIRIEERLANIGDAIARFAEREREGR